MDFDNFYEITVDKAAENQDTQNIALLGPLRDTLCVFYSEGYKEGRDKSAQDSNRAVLNRVLKILEEWRNTPLLEAGTFQTFLLKALGYQIDL